MSSQISRRRLFCRETFHPLPMKYTENILTFAIGDELEHRKDADNGTGIIAFNRRTEETGFVSNEFLFKSKDYCECKESWHFGETPRDVVDEYIEGKNNIYGSFLVRSSTSKPGDYVLHIKIYDFVAMKFNFSRVLIQHDRKSFTLDNESYEKLTDLIETLKSQGFKLRNQSGLIRPTNPCLILRSQMPGSKVIQPWQVHENDIEMGAFIRSEFPALVFHGKFRGVVDATVEVIGPMGRYQLKADQKQQLAEEYKHSSLWSINHPNIMQMLGMSYNPSTKVYHLILEGAQHGPLDSLLREQGRTIFKFHLFISFARDILHALSYLQSKEYVHGNIGAHAIYINELMQAKLTHLKLDYEVSEYEKVDRNFKGKINCSAIEVVEGNHASHASDLWSFGVLLWEMLNFGEIPFHGLCKETMVQLVRDEHYLPPLQTHFIDVPNEVLNRVYFKMIVASWNLDPVKRPSARRLERRLQEVEKMMVACDNDGNHPLSLSNSIPGSSTNGTTENLSESEESTDSYSDSASESNSSSNSSDDQVVEEYK